MAYMNYQNEVLTNSFFSSGLKNEISVKYMYLKTVPCTVNVPNFSDSNFHGFVN